MEIRQLKYFLTVADARSFVNAADSLFVTRQAISKSIAQLESELGVELFMRESNGAFLTPAGVLFYDRIRSAVMDFDRIREDMMNYGNRYNQTLKVSMSMGVRGLFGEFLENFGAAQRNVTVEVVECLDADCADRLKLREADIALTTSPIQDRLVVSKPIYHCPYCIGIHKSHPLAHKKQVTVDDLRGVPLISYLSGHPDTSHRYTDLDYDESFHIRYCGNDLSYLFSLLERNKGIMLISRDMIPPSMQDVVFRASPLEGSWFVYFCYYKATEKNAMMGNLLDQLYDSICLL